MPETAGAIVPVKPMSPEGGRFLFGYDDIPAADEAGNFRQSSMAQRPASEPDSRLFYFEPGYGPTSFPAPLAAVASVL